MDLLFAHNLSGGHALLLFLCLAIALAFEFVNGFHDTANAVATVIYTHSLPPRLAVLISGIFNFLGVFAGGIGVALGIMKLLPADLVAAGGTGAGLAMVLALLLAAILWNLGTWYFGIPASSSHTLIGAILGVGLANSLLPGHRFGHGVHWGKAEEIALSLLVSPLVGMFLAAVVYLTMRRFVKNRALYVPPQGETPPPWSVRGLLLFTSAGVSFAHGSNDGQKGVGLVMVILMGLVPAGFAINQHAPVGQLAQTEHATVVLDEIVAQHAHDVDVARVTTTRAHLARVRSLVHGRTSASEVPAEERAALRQAILSADRSLEAISKPDGMGLNTRERAQLTAERTKLRKLTEYAPTWVLAMIALALGVGTLFGWKRIVVTVGEKIGKSHLTYAQGASAELVAMSTIGIAALSGLPVSTTHVLSSGVAGTMLAQGSGVQRATARNILLAWALTLPVTTLLSGGLFLVLRAVL